MAAAAVHREGLGKRGREREEGRRRTSSSPGSSCRGLCWRGRAGDAGNTAGGDAATAGRSGTRPRLRASPARFLQWGGSRGRGGDGGVLGLARVGQNDGDHDDIGGGRRGRGADGGDEPRLPASTAAAGRWRSSMRRSWRHHLSSGRPETSAGTTAVVAAAGEELGRTNLVSIRSLRVERKVREGGERRVLLMQQGGGPATTCRERAPRRHGAQGRSCGDRERGDHLFVDNPLAAISLLLFSFIN